MPDTAKTIMSVAIKLFFKKGYFATSLSDIAKLTGIKKASLYYHFPKKENLLQEILVTTMRDLSHELDKALSEGGPINIQFERAIASHINFHIRRQKEVFIADSELRGLSATHLALILQMRKDYEARFQALIAEGINARVFAQTDVKVASYAILTLCTAVATWFKNNGPLTGDEIVRIYQNLIFNGLKPNSNGVNDLSAATPSWTSCENGISASGCCPAGKPA